jgi:hypothetical protein
MSPDAMNDETWQTKKMVKQSPPQLWVPGVSGAPMAGTLIEVRVGVTRMFYTLRLGARPQT